jgi:hypothetical protein
MKTHFASVHQAQKDHCEICAEQVQIGRPMVRHMKRMHICDCHVVLTHLSKDIVRQYAVPSQQASVVAQSEHLIQSASDDNAVSTKIQPKVEISKTIVSNAPDSNDKSA